MSEESIGDLDQALADTCGDKECNILLYIATLKSTQNPITVEQMQLFGNSLDKYVSDSATSFGDWVSMRADTMESLF